MRFVLIGESLVATSDDDHAEISYAGRGVFETMRGVASTIPWLDRHFARLRRSAERLGFVLPLDRLQGELLRTLAKARLPHARVRVAVGALAEGEWSLWAQVLPLKVPEGDLVAGLLSGHPGATTPMAGLKVLGHAPFHMLFDQARAEGWDEALLLDSQGQIVEGTRTNVFVWSALGAVLTPPLAAGPLPGVARAWVLERLQARGVEASEVPLYPADLQGARGIFVSNAVLGVRRIRRLGEMDLPCRADQSLLEALEREFREAMGI